MLNMLKTTHTNISEITLIIFVINQYFTILIIFLFHYKKQLRDKNDENNVHKDFGNNMKQIEMSKTPYTCILSTKMSLQFIM